MVKVQIPSLKKQSSFIKSKTERSWEQHCGRRYHRTHSPQGLVSFNIFNYSFQVISPHSSSNGAFYRAFRWWGMKSELHASFLMAGGRGEQLRIWARWQHGWEGGGKKNVFMKVDKEDLEELNFRPRTESWRRCRLKKWRRKPGLIRGSLQKVWKLGPQTSTAETQGCETLNCPVCLCPFSWKCVGTMLSSLITNVGRCSTALCTMSLLCTV